MRKAFSSFAWGTSSFDEEVLKNVEVYVPITKSNKVDLVFMVHFIRAAMKLAIRCVAERKDREIEATRRISELDGGKSRNPTILSDVSEILKYREYFPLYSLRAACGKFGEGEDVECKGWVRVMGRYGRNENLFVIQAIGHSMEELIKDGQFCVFEYRNGEWGNDDIVLVQERTIADPETGGSYTIKKIRKKGKAYVLYPVNLICARFELNEGCTPRVIGTYRGDIGVCP